MDKASGSPTTRGWLAEHLFSSAPPRVWAAVYGMFGLTYAATLAIRRLWAPDTKYYAALALRYAGHQQNDAARTIAAYIRPFGPSWGHPTAKDLFGGGGVVGPRVVYPALSAPFVRVFGLDGMAVAPALGLLVLVGLLLLTLSARFGWVAALPVLVLLATSSGVMFFGSAMLTDGLATTWSALLLFVGLRTHSFRSAGVWLLVGITVLLAFTRQSTLIPAGAFLLTWLALFVRTRMAANRWAPAALAVGATTVLTQLLQAVVWPGYSQLRQLQITTHAKSLRAALRDEPRVILHLARLEIGHLAQSDLSQLVLLAAAVVAGVLLWRHEETFLAIGALTGAAVYTITAAASTGFRYGLPALPYVALLVAALVSRLGAVRRRPPAEAAPDDEPVTDPPPKVVESLPRHAEQAGAAVGPVAGMTAPVQPAQTAGRSLTRPRQPALGSG